MADKKQDHTLDHFKKLVRKAIFLTQEEEVHFNKIPDQQWQSIFQKNFSGNYKYAERVLLNKFSEIEKIDGPEVDAYKKKIHNLGKATKMMTDAIDSKIPILFITDFDNDGSLAQAIINEYLKIDRGAAKNMHVDYAQVVNGNANRGFTIDLVDKIIQSKGMKVTDKFLIVTADNGINSREEQIKLENKYPNIKILITDHHNPEPEMVIEENDNTIIFNPHFKPTPFFKQYNISGAATVGVLLKNLLEKRFSEVQLLPFKQNLRNINKISKVSNVLDYVDSHPADKPEKDYVVSRFLELQPLLNINNSITKMITGEISQETIEAIRSKIPKLNVDLLREEAKNIQTQNSIAKVLLKIYSTHKGDGSLQEADFNNIFLKEINNEENYLQEEVVDENFIGQLRPVIFGLTADDEKIPFLDAVNQKMIEVFENVKTSEKKMAIELREGEVITKSKLENSTIAYTDQNILTIFNRKFLNKVYNDENPGFTLTLDSIGKGKVSGSFRSLYDISDILKEKKKLERMLNVKIETPGHERAAGFIVKSNNPEKTPVTEETITTINNFINDSITNIKANEAVKNNSFILTDMENIHILDRINRVVRGNVANFERLVPIVKLTPDTIWTDSYTTEQFSMDDVVKNRKYGYITINTNFHGDTVIIPVELIRKIVKNGYNDYLSLNYMDGGVFMAERVVANKDATNIIDLTVTEGKSAYLSEVFEKDFKDKNIIELSREQIRDNPFFKYHDYGDLNFDLFEKMVIGIIDSNKIDTLAVFDVEANGFGNARLMNFGATNYSIDENTGKDISKDDFFRKVYYSQRGEEYVLTDEQLGDLIEVSEEERVNLPLEMQQQILLKYDQSMEDEYKCYLYPVEKQVKLRNKLRLPFEQLSNFIEKNDKVIYNRSIKANMLAYLIKDDDYKTGQEIINLTGITQEVLRKHGKYTSEVDTELSEFYKDKSVLFGAHNTPYDSKILRANMPKMYQVLNKSHIYDSALFSKKEKLAYDFIQGAHFENVSGIDKSIFFYHNDFSEFNLKKLLESKKDGYYPDRSGRYLFEVKDNEYFLVDKEKHEKVKIQSDVKKAMSKMNIDSLFEIVDDKYVLKSAQSLTPVSIDKKMQKMLDKIKRSTPTGLFALKEDGILLLETDDLMDGGKRYEFVDTNVKKDGPKVIPILTYQNELIENLKIDKLPETAVKYSVEKLSEQWMIHALLLSDEKFKIDYVDTSKPQYAAFQGKEQDLKFFQDTYHFDTSIERNVQQFSNYYQQKNHKSFIDIEPGKADEKETDIQAFNDFVNEFLDLNKNIQQKFADAWMYKKVLEIKDPKRIEITNDLVDLVNYQTNIPVDKIKTIFDEAIKFKEKHKLTHILQHEQHVNGLWEGDIKGDVLFEDKLTLSLLAQRMYDAYQHDEQPAIDTFNAAQLEARKAFDLAHYLADDLANDSYSFRQGLLFNRDVQSKLVNSIQAKERDALLEENENVIKFKLDTDVLAQDHAIYAIAKQGGKISRENIEEDKEKFSFIMMNEQIRNGLSLVTNEDAHTAVQDVLKANEELMKQYKEELSERYRYVEFNKRDFNIKKTVDMFINALNGEVKCEPNINEDTGEKTWKMVGARDELTIPLESVDQRGFEVVKRVVYKYVNNHNRINEYSMPNETEVIQFLEALGNKIQPTTLEQALADPTKEFSDFAEIKDPNFLETIETKKTKPLNALLNKNMELRLINPLVEKLKKNMNEPDMIMMIGEPKPRP
jgi:hypothetical protein